MSDQSKRKHQHSLRPDEFAIAAGYDNNFRFYLPTDRPKDVHPPVTVRVLTAVASKLQDPAFLNEMLVFVGESGVCTGECGGEQEGTES